MRVLLIGDSIRMFYPEEVKKQLGKDYEVFSPQENCRFSAYTLNSLRFWLDAFPSPDVIHFNVGLWDTAILYHEDGCFTKLSEYLENMQRILRELKKTGAKIIFATTTPVSDEKVSLPGPMPPAHRNEDINRYNQAILDIFKDEDIVINDLFEKMYSAREEYISEDMIHPNEKGVEYLGEIVADVIKACGFYGNNMYKKVCDVTREEKTIQ